MEFITHIYTVTATYPKHEFYGLVNQIRRAAVSIALNIAEGSGAGGDIEFIRFLRFSLRSGYEVMTGIEIALRLHYGNLKDSQDLMGEVDELGAMLTGLIG